MSSDFFDYSSIMLKMADLSKQIRQLLIENKVEEANPLVQELIAETRLLQVWILDQMENNGHSNN